MTATLVLGGLRSGKSRHAAALLSRHPEVTFIETHGFAEPAGDPAAVRTGHQQQLRPGHWRTLETLDLTRALLASRHPVLIDDLGSWLHGVLDEEAASQDLEHAREVVGGRIDELSVALRAVPFEVVAVSHDPSWVRFPDDPAERLYVELLAHLNQRVSAASSRVFAIMAGRVVDLSAAPLLGAV